MNNKSENNVFNETAENLIQFCKIFILSLAHKYKFI